MFVQDASNWNLIDRDQERETKETKIPAFLLALTSKH